MAKPGSALASESVPPQERRMEPSTLGLLLFIAIEIMFFAGMISAFLVFRLGSSSWPPAGQPRLPVEITAVNTLLLLLSGVSMQGSLMSLRSGNSRFFLWALGLTALLGTAFLSIQGTEWVRLVHFGLSAQSNVYGGFFYALIGLHGLHVTGGLLALLWVGQRAFRGAYGPARTLGVELCRTYWFFVVGLWPVLFVLVYL